MEGLKGRTPFASFVADALHLESFTLIDVGCGLGIDDAWRVFGSKLKAYGFDPNIEEIRRLSKMETNAGVLYTPAFVGVPPDVQGAWRVASRQFWDRWPWSRLSANRTLEIEKGRLSNLGDAEKAKHNLWGEVPLASEVVVLPTFLKDHGVDNVDFIKIDADGPDFLILQSLESILRNAKVLGVGVEVNFPGSADPEIHTFHNIDRFLKQNGFEIFLMSTRPYSMASLPAPYQLPIAAQTSWGRILQGDAVYFRDAAAPYWITWAESAGPEKLMKLAASFSLFGLPDCAAEVIVRFRPTLEKTFDVVKGLDILTKQALYDGHIALSYAEYMAEFERNSPLFWPGKQTAKGS